MQAPLAEIVLQNDKVELGEKYNMKISSRFQPLLATTAHYHFPLPTSEQNRRYSNVRPSRLVMSHDEGQPTSQPPEVPSEVREGEKRPTPLLSKLTLPEREGMVRLRPGVAYSISRLEEWFCLLDTNRSGEVTVRKLILGMMKHQAIYHLVSHRPDQKVSSVPALPAAGDHGFGIHAQGEVRGALVEAAARG